MLLKIQEWTYFWSDSSVHSLISGRYQRLIWSVWFNVCACKSVQRQQAPGSLCGSAGAAQAATAAIMHAAGASCCQGCVSLYWGAGEGKNSQVQMCLPGQWGFLLLLFAVLFSLQKVNHQSKTEYFHRCSFVFLDRNILFSYGRCAFGNTSVNVPHICLLKIF